MDSSRPLVRVDKLRVTTCGPKTEGNLRVRARKWMIFSLEVNINSQNPQFYPQEPCTLLHVPYHWILPHPTSPQSKDNATSYSHYFFGNRFQISLSLTRGLNLPQPKMWLPSIHAYFQLSSVFLHFTSHFPPTRATI